MVESGKKVLIFGEILIDSLEGQWYPGGAPFNVAAHLNQFNHQVHFISAVGNDPEGEYLVNYIKQQELDCQYLQHNSYPTGVVEVQLINSEPEYNILNHRSYDYITVPPIEIEELDLIYYGTLALRNPRSRQTLDSIKDGFKGVSFVDINIRHPWFHYEDIKKYLTNIDWLKINIDELHELIPGNIPVTEKVKTLSAENSIKNIICTRGTESILLYSKDSDQIIYQNIVPNKQVISTIGAGDSFSAIAIDALLKEEDLPLLLQRASIISSAICSYSGAIPENRQFYKGLNYGY